MNYFFYQISIDFETLFPDKTNNFFMNWTKLNEILPLYINLKDLKLKALWAEAKEKWNGFGQNSKDAVLIYLIHGVLKPDRCHKDIGRPTIADSQMSTIKFLEEDIEVDLYSCQPPFLLI
ncbi:hypothetical protein CVS40_11142 [Lucilia cuprina]|nr:hypothetical protein CVS40_11142 [Lucilia cuprina]